MSGFDAILKKRTALGFFWLALTGFLAMTGGGGRKRNFTSTFIPAKTTPPAKPFGFLGVTLIATDPEARLFTGEPSAVLAEPTFTVETLGKPLIMTFTSTTSQRTWCLLFLHCFPARTTRKTSSR